MNTQLKIAVAGVGLIGRRHAELLRAGIPDVELSAIVDPSEQGREYADSAGARWYPALDEMFANTQPDGVIIATPNQLHVQNGLECVAAGCPMMVEKPIGTSSTEAQKLVDEAKAKKVPVLVGHHRRHNPIIQKARALIDAGYIGQITTVHSNCWFLKPAEYFTPEWRRKSGAGPVMINLIHDIDLLRYLCGEIVSVQAIYSSATRKFEVEDSAAVLLRFQSGAIGTMTLSDTVASPWSWESTSGENREFPATQESCYMLGGTLGSLSIPDLKVWRHQGEGHWKQPISAISFPRDSYDPLAAQIKHFAKVIQSAEAPLVSGEEGLKSLQALEAVQQSALANDTVELPVLEALLT